MEETNYNIRGIGNRIDLQCNDIFKDKIYIEISGNNNVVIIEQFVEVSDSLEISIVDDNSYVYIGKGSTFEETSIAVADSNNKVIIREDCMFARATKVLASDFHSIIDLSTGKRKNVSREVVIDNHVWLGLGVIVLKNTHIMSNSIIGANSVVHGTIRPNSLFMGNKMHKRMNWGGAKHELTWERSRDVKIMPVPKIIHLYKKVKLSLNCDVVFNIENGIEDCMNRIQGWAFLKGVDSKDSVVYIHMALKRKIMKEIILPLKVIERIDVAEAFSDSQYMNCGFSAYMPAEIIINQKNMSKIELVVENGDKRGGVIIKQMLH